MPLEQSTDLMGDIIEETIDRLRGGSIDDPWWRRILHKIGQSYISPDDLLVPEIQKWLAESQVVEDLKTFAKIKIMDSGQHDAAIRTRLVKSYSELQGEVTGDLAADTIETVVNILCAGFMRFYQIPRSNVLTLACCRISSNTTANGSADWKGKFREGFLTRLLSKPIQNRHSRSCPGYVFSEISNRLLRNAAWKSWPCECVITEIFVQPPLL